jgi:hypothetical protein
MCRERGRKNLSKVRSFDIVQKQKGAEAPFCKLPSVATSAATATAIASAATTPAATSATIFAGTGFVNDHITAVILLPIKLCDRAVSSVFASHLYESEPARTAGFAIHNDVSRVDFAGRRKIFLKVFACDTKRQISHVKFRTHFPLN